MAAIPKTSSNPSVSKTILDLAKNLSATDDIKKEHSLVDLFFKVSAHEQLDMACQELLANSFCMKLGSDNLPLRAKLIEGFLRLNSLVFGKVAHILVHWCNEIAMFSDAGFKCLLIRLMRHVAEGYPLSEIEVGSILGEKMQKPFKTTILNVAMRFMLNLIGDLDARVRSMSLSVIRALFTVKFRHPELRITNHDILALFCRSGMKKRDMQEVYCGNGIFISGEAYAASIKEIDESNKQVIKTRRDCSHCSETDYSFSRPSACYGVLIQSIVDSVPEIRLQAHHFLYELLSILKEAKNPKSELKICDEPFSPAIQQLIAAHLIIGMDDPAVELERNIPLSILNCFQNHSEILPVVIEIGGDRFVDLCCMMVMHPFFSKTIVASLCFCEVLSKVKCLKISQFLPLLSCINKIISSRGSLPSMEKRFEKHFQVSLELFLKLNIEWVHKTVERASEVLSSMDAFVMKVWRHIEENDIDN
eukprot:TRINITY_DN109056_c0_g1_i1.p1 TRINITY_DN109056_c0_g1~~TRINITY_DN109056_c0_g1_i1.p1  ORF type:complete len:476 (-),score=76.44 TRINITY_DN109056_c0_g1_i1:86-1513(-)